MTTRWDGQERRKNVVFSADEINEMLVAAAEAGATAAIQKLYAEIGQSLVKRTVLLVGTLVAAFFAWVNNYIHIDGPHK